MAETELGKVTHYFDKAGVMVVLLSSKIAKGDTIKIKRGDAEFEEKIESMQIEHQNIDSAKAGDEVAIKISQPTKEGALVCKVE